MKNILFVQPNFTVGTDLIKEHWLPYSVGLLWSYASKFKTIQDNFTVQDILFKRDPINSVITKITEPDIVCFSNYMWNWEYNKVLAKTIKEKYPNCLIIFGGPQVTDKPFEKLFFTKHPYVDCIVNGEGEESFKEILVSIINEQPIKKTYKSERINELDNIPSPYLTGVFDKIIQDNPNTSWQMVIETNRGCPFGCTFCDWGSTTLSKIKKFDITRVKQEVEWACKNKIKNAYIADANFGIFYERDKEIANSIIEIQKQYGHEIQYFATWNKNSQKKTLEIAQILSGNGVTVAVQSLNDQVLKAIKRDNMDVNNMRSILLDCEEKNIPVYTELILGLPYETFESWQEGFFELMDIGLHSSADVYFLTVLENSEINSHLQQQEHELDLIIADFNNTHGDDIIEKQIIVKGTKYMPERDLIKSYMFAWMIVGFHYSGLTQVYSRYLSKRETVSFKEFYTKLFQYITSNEYFNQHYQTTVSIIKNYFNTGVMTDPYCANKVGWNTAIVMFNDLSNVYKELDKFVNNNWSIPIEVVDFQHNFVVDINKDYPINYQRDVDVYGYVFKNTEYNKHINYTFDIGFKYTDKREFLRRMYSARRANGSKVKIQ